MFDNILCFKANGNLTRFELAGVEYCIYWFDDDDQYDGLVWQRTMQCNEWRAF